jgi:hypothetical protein
MKRLSVRPLAVVCWAVVACLAGQAGASDWANPDPSAYYGYGMAGYNGAYSASDMAGYPGYGGYAGYGYGGYGYGGNGGCAACEGHGHCCSFGGNSTCCANCWDGYRSGSYGVKVRHRHRPLGCGAGPCVDGSCSGLSAGYATNCGRRCFLRRNRSQAYGATCGCADCGGGAVMDQSPTEPSMSGPTPTESLQAPPPSMVEPPSPGDDSST